MGVYLHGARGALVILLVFHQMISFKERLVMKKD